MKMDNLKSMLYESSITIEMFLQEIHLSGPGKVMSILFLGFAIITIPLWWDIMLSIMTSLF